MTKSVTHSRCLCCGQLCVPPEKDKPFRCGRCWTMVEAGTCLQGHNIARPVFNPQTPCIYCSGKAPIAGPQTVATRLVGVRKRTGA